MKRINIGPADFETFIAVAELGSFRRAAERLSLSQPAVTQRVLRLERTLGMTLFDRTTRRVNLSEAGARLLLKAQPTIAALRSILEEFHDETTMKSGKVSFGVSPSLASSVIPPILRDFMDKYPGVAVQLFDDLAGLIVDRLIAGQLDFGIVPRSRISDELSFEPLFNDKLFAVVSRGHPLSHMKAVPLEKLLQYPLLSHPIEAAIRNSFFTSAQDDQYLPKPVLEARNLSTLLAMVEAGLGITLLPEILRSWLPHESVVTVKISAPQISRTIGILTRRERSLSTPATVFLQMIREQLRQR